MVEEEGNVASAEVRFVAMADSEVKARRKLEEAERKCRGSGGFLGKIFGGSSADETADLFVQSSVTSDDDNSKGVDDEFSSDGSPSAECELCGRDFNDIVTFESHYRTAHSHECSVCSKMFLSQKALHIHIDETHCPFHRLHVEKNPSGNHFRCYETDCMNTFATGKDRDLHCRQKHNIESVEVTIERRKFAKRVHELELSFTRMGVRPKNKRRAGNLFKMAKLWKEGGDAFVRAAELNGTKGDSKHECASQYAEAANCYRKINPQLAVDCLLKTCEIYTDMGRFNMAAKNHVTIAELFEAECPDTEQCIQHYQKAADYYKGEESKSSATKCLIKVAQDVIACLEDGNEELFTDTVKAYDKISRLDQWHTGLLVKIKRTINKEDEDDLK
uniref:C2H2-type domain-containing protein n=1 Tax=Angiostrongylus cantonensis TaxID=6313 RepID=A0A158P9N7_ANGCA